MITDNQLDSLATGLGLTMMALIIVGILLDICSDAAALPLSECQCRIRLEKLGHLRRRNSSTATNRLHLI